MENHLWGQATWTELARLGLAVRERGGPDTESGGADGSAHAPPGSRVVALLPTGAVEAHGPHLPLTTDVTIANAAAQAALPGLRRLGLHPVILPPLPYTAAPFAAGFPGTISVRPATVTALLADVAASLERQGAAALVVVNAHLDPAHLDAIRKVVRGGNAAGAAVPSRHPGEAPARDAAPARDEAPTRDGAPARHEAPTRDEATARDQGWPMPVIHPDLTERRWASRLTAEFRSGACHAGSYETSVVMVAAPELVREDERRGLAKNPASLSVAIREGAATFEEAGVTAAYCGDPAAATREEGEETLEVLARIVVEAVEERLGRETRPA